MLRPHRHPYALAMAGAGLALALASHPAHGAELVGRAAFTDPRNPPPWTEVHPAARRDFDLGQAIFKTQWLPAGHANATRREGLGPLFVQPSCDACHANGARGRPPAAGEPLSGSFVMQLEGAPAYGHVLNTQAIAGHVPEGRVSISWQPRGGSYPDGQRWTLREPRYALRDLSAGAMPAGTVLKPRIAPAVYGAGLLDGALQSAVQAIQQAQPESLRGSAGGRFGWQGNAVSLVDQTAQALAREMGITSELEPQDDCTPAQAACRAPHGGAPEVAEQLFHALTTFQFLLAAPARGVAASPGADVAGAALFERVGCAACHVPHLPIPHQGGEAHIDPYTDLLLHDLGPGLADRTIEGRVTQSRWRTAPLWGLAEALRSGPPALLHDGRAATLEEAILWHEGQAAAARANFMALDAATRRQLLDWLATL